MTSPDVTDLQTTIEANTAAAILNAAAADRLGEKIDNRKRIDRLQLIFVVAGVVASIVACLLLWNVITGRSTNRDNTKYLIQVVQRLDDCTTAGTPKSPHKCYDDGRASQGSAIAELLHRGALAQVEIVACEKSTPDAATFRSCVDLALPDLAAG